MGKTIEELRKMIKESPEKCPITGLIRCDEYTIEGNVLYLSNPALDAYTLPEYDEEAQEFNRYRYDMDDDFRKDYEFLCSLDDLRDRPDFEKIKEFYQIKE